MDTVFYSSPRTGVYDPKTFFLHAALLGQGSLHCPIFPTAASRRSLGRVSVPMWPVTLSGRLLIVALVGRYPTNQLIRRGSISYHRSFSHCAMRHCALMRFYQPFPAAIPLYEAGYPRVTHPSATNFEKQALHRPFDLHVLGAPPAFILSQDRTLRPNMLGLEPVRSSQSLADRFRSIHMVLV